jgi:hypothetical protein
VTVSGGSRGEKRDRGVVGSAECIQQLNEALARQRTAEGKVWTLTDVAIEGQFIKLENSSQKSAAYIGVKSDEVGMIALYDKQGNKVVQIYERGFLILKDNQWVEPYVRK